MCDGDGHHITVAVKVVLNPNTINQSIIAILVTLPYLLTSFCLFQMVEPQKKKPLKAFKDFQKVTSDVDLSFELEDDIDNMVIFLSWVWKVVLALYNTISLFSPFPNKSWFLRVRSISLLKSICSFPTLFSTCLENFLPFS